MNLLGLSAYVPVIEVVPAVLLILSLPLAHRASLMLNHNALLELCIEVSATISTIHGNEKGVKLLTGVLLWLEDVVGDARLVIEKCHLLFRRLIIIIYYFFQNHEHSLFRIFISHQPHS